MLNKISTLELAARILIRSNGWTLIVVSDERDGIGKIEELHQLLTFQSDDKIEILSAVSSPMSFVDKLRASSAQFCITNTSVFDSGAWTEVDLLRSRLTTLKGVILTIHQSAFSGLQFNAPNFYSWFGSAIYECVEQDSAMSQEKIEIRLSQLKDLFSLKNEEVIKMAESNQLPPDPEFIEWLILLGKGDLIAKNTGG